MCLYQNVPDSQSMGPSDPSMSPPQYCVLQLCVTQRLWTHICLFAPLIAPKYVCPSTTKCAPQELSPQMCVSSLQQVCLSDVCFHAPGWLIHSNVSLGGTEWVP